MRPTVKRASARLIYHDVVAPAHREQVGFSTAVADVYKLTPEQFTAHLEAIAASGAQVGLDPAQETVMLTFDDGGASAPGIADELERRGWRGAFFVVTGKIGSPGFVDVQQVRELARRGHLVGSHSHTHPAYMGRLDQHALAEEWTTSRQVLQEVLRAPPSSAAVPGGSVSRALLEAVAAAGYRRLYTSTPRLRARRHGELEVFGRHTIWAGDPPQLAAALASGRGTARARRLASWQLKSSAKRLHPALYERMRNHRAQTLR